MSPKLVSLGEAAALAAIIAVLNFVVAGLNTTGFNFIHALDWSGLINVALIAAVGSFTNSQLKGKDGEVLGSLRGF